MAIAVGLVSKLLELSNAKRSATLEVSTSREGVRIYVEDGSIVFADERDTRDLTVDQVCAVVMRALGWPAARITVTDGIDPASVRARFALRFEALILTTLKEATPESVDALLAEFLLRHPALREDKELGCFALSAEEANVLSALDGSRTLAEVLEQPSTARVAPLLATMVLTDVIDLHAVRRNPATRAQAPRERLRSHGELAIPTPRTAVAPVAKQLADTAFQRGSGFLHVNDLVQAATELRRAAMLFPTAEYELWAAWCEFRLHHEAAPPDPETIAGLRRKAERALQETPGLAHGSFVLSQIATLERAATAPDLLQPPRVAPFAPRQAAFEVASPSPRRGAWIGLAITLLVGGAATAGVAVHVLKPRTTLTSSTSSSASASTVLAVSSEPHPSIFDPEPAIPPTTPTPSPAPTMAPAPTTSIGRLEFPPKSKGHRVFVDGHVSGATPTAISLACGTHVVRIGTNGRSHQIDVPCGSGTIVPYP